MKDIILDLASQILVDELETVSRLPEEFNWFRLSDGKVLLISLLYTTYVDVHVQIFVAYQYRQRVSLDPMCQTQTLFFHMHSLSHSHLFPLLHLLQCPRSPIPLSQWRAMMSAVP